MGPNGSGKSTTAKIALGILKPDAGSVILHTNKIAYVPQNLNIDWTLPLRVLDFMRLIKSFHQMIKYIQLEYIMVKKKNFRSL